MKRDKGPAFPEFIAILSMMTALGAFSIDAMLPALGAIGKDLSVGSANDRQLVVSFIFIGQALGQFLFGPLSDAVGRKKAIYGGYAVFIAGSLVCLFSFSFPMMLAGRMLQGLGVSSSMAVGLALVRDLFEGRKMARVMSFVMTMFILIPMVAPIIGQSIYLMAGWRSIFGVLLLFAMITVLWVAARIPESLSEDRRIPFSVLRILKSAGEIFHIRSVVAFVVTAGIVQGYFLGYLNSAPQIFQEQYGLGELFPYIFALLSFAIGLATLLNSRLVMRLGMALLVRWALIIELILSVFFTGVSYIYSGHPPLWSLILFLMGIFFCTGILFGNLNALAMEPLGRLAGIGAAIVGAFTTLLSVPIGLTVGRAYNGTVMPLVMAILILAVAANITVRLGVSARRSVNEP